MYVDDSAFNTRWLCYVRLMLGLLVDFGYD
jgi:hypothetical protein